MLAENHVVTRAYFSEVSMSDSELKVDVVVASLFGACLILADHYSAGIFFEDLPVVCYHYYSRTFLPVDSCE